jgi:aspartate/methionine/tyrosine aminotransferase
MDKVPEPCKQEVMLTEGAERAFSILIRALIVDGRDAIMLPAPHYSLHKDAIISAGGTVGEYRLNGEKEWDIDFEDLESVLGKLGLAGKRPKAIIIINPGNPTGYTFSPKTIAKVLEFAVSHRLLVIADEVFRENIDQDTSFKSCRSVLETLSPQMR